MTIKVFGQAAPAAGTPTSIYTVPLGKTFVSSYLNVLNRGSNSSFSIAVRVGGAPLANQHWLHLQETINAGHGVPYCRGMTLSAGDIVVVQGTSANISFSLFGEELP